jgi:hypothetical protein
MTSHGADAARSSRPQPRIRTGQKVAFPDICFFLQFRPRASANVVNNCVHPRVSAWRARREPRVSAAAVFFEPEVSPSVMDASRRLPF